MNNLKIFILVSSLFFTSFTQASSLGGTITLPDNPNRILDLISFDQDEWEAAVKSEEILLNAYSKSIRNQLPRDYFFRLMMTYGAPNYIIYEFRYTTSRYASGDLSYREAKGMLRDVVKNFAQKREPSANYTGKNTGAVLVVFLIGLIPIILIAAIFCGSYNCEWDL